MGDKLGNSRPQGVFSEQNRAVQTGFLDGPYEALGMGIQIRGSRESVNFRGQARVLCSDESFDLVLRLSTPRRFARRESPGLASPVGAG